MANTADSHPFSSDRPITSQKEDLLGRSQFAESLASAIKGWKGNDSLVVALHGPWGSGKSSIKNIILESLRKSKKSCPEVVEFNPWQCAGQEQLAEAFFQEIGVVLGTDTSKKGKERVAKWRAYGTYLTMGAKLAKSFKVVLPLLGIPGSTIFELIAKGLQGSSEVTQEGSEALTAQAEALDRSLVDMKKDLFDALKTMKRPLLVVMDEKDFQSRCNNHKATTTHSAYQVCRSLKNAHADFLYIARLCYHFIEEDFSSKQNLEDEKKELNFFRVKVHYNSSAPAWVRKLISQQKEICRGHLEWAYQREVDARDEKEFGKGFLRKVKNSRDFKSAMKKVREVVQKNEQLTGSLWRYHSLALSTREGRKEDPWGSFFLLAVSEHLRGVTGKPNYLLAARLLKLVRGQKRSSGQKEEAVAKLRDQQQSSAQKERAVAKLRGQKTVIWSKRENCGYDESGKAKEISSQLEI